MCKTRYHPNKTNKISSFSNFYEAYAYAFRDEVFLEKVGEAVGREGSNEKNIYDRKTYIRTRLSCIKPV